MVAWRLGERTQRGQDGGITKGHEKTSEGNGYVPDVSEYNITCNKTLNVCSLLYVNSISKILKGKNQKAGNSPGIA